MNDRKTCDTEKLVQDIVDSASRIERVAPQRRLVRFLSWLGFGAAPFPDIPDELEHHPGLAASTLDSIMVTQLSWADRLRLLVSGTLMMHTRHKTDRPVGEVYSFSTFGVLPPFVDPERFMPARQHMLPGSGPATLAEWQRRRDA